VTVTSLVSFFLFAQFLELGLLILIRCAPPMAEFGSRYEISIIGQKEIEKVSINKARLSVKFRRFSKGS